MHNSLIWTTLAADDPSPTAVITIVVGLGLLMLTAIVLIKYGNLWLQAWVSGAPISIVELVGMTFRKVNAGVIVNSRIMGIKAGVHLETADLEAHYMAGGSVNTVIRALIAAKKAGSVDLTWTQAAAIDLAGRDVLDAVRTSVNPRVIDCPAPGGGRATIDAIAKDGIQLRAKARVTVRANIKRLVGGATEETIIARVGEGIVTTIGSSDTHKQVLADPDLISQCLQGKGLDSGTAFEILSIDIADIDVGDNIGARLQADQAEADKRIAQAKAEERRAMAVAMEQENLARIQENRAKVVLAEAEVPKAMAEAFRTGNLGIMDYYRMKNIQADTKMRDSLSGNS